MKTSLREDLFSEYEKCIWCDIMVKLIKQIYGCIVEIPMLKKKIK